MYQKHRPKLSRHFLTTIGEHTDVKSTAELPSVPFVRHSESESSLSPPCKPGHRAPHTAPCCSWVLNVQILTCRLDRCFRRSFQPAPSRGFWSSSNRLWASWPQLQLIDPQAGSPSHRKIECSWKVGLRCSRDYELQLGYWCSTASSEKPAASSGIRSVHVLLFRASCQNKHRCGLI